MKHDLGSLKAALASTPAVSVNARLTRRVEFSALIRYNPPNWLYASGKAKRYNSAGVHCVYFGGDVDVTRAEYEDMWKGLIGAGQPATEYSADVKLRRVLDLTSGATLKALRIEPKDLFRNWRRAKHPTLTQLLGQAVSETMLFAAIRYPSRAAAGRGEAGINFVIFRACVRLPDFVRVIGPTRKPLQQWP